MIIILLISMKPIATSTLRWRNCLLGVRERGGAAEARVGCAPGEAGCGGAAFGRNPPRGFSQTGGEAGTIADIRGDDLEHAGAGCWGARQRRFRLKRKAVT